MVEPTIKGVNAAANQVVVGSSGLDGANFYLLIVLMMGLILTLILLLLRSAQNVQKEEISKMKMVSIIAVDGLSAAFVWYLLLEVSNLPTEQQIEELKKDKNQWEERYAKPYIESLPRQKETLKSVEYNFSLSKAEGNDWKKIISEELTPLKITYENGKVEELWSRLVIDAKIEQMFVEQQVLSEEIRFEPSNGMMFTPLQKLWDETSYEPGIYNTVVHIQQKF